MSRVWGLLTSLIVGFVAGILYNSEKLYKNTESEGYAIFSDGIITEQQVYDRVGSQILELERALFELKKNSVDQILTEKVAAPVPANMIDQIEVTEKEIEEFAKQTNQVFSKMSALDKKNLLGNLKLKKIKDQGRETIEKKLAEFQVEYKIPSPRWQKMNLEPSQFFLFDEARKGKDVIYLGHFQCTKCGEVIQNLEKITKKLSGKIKLSMRFKGVETEGSLAISNFKLAYCAAKNKSSQNLAKEIAMLPLASGELIHEKAKQQNLSDCFLDPKINKEILEDQKQTSGIGVTDIPYLVVEGNLIPATEKIENLELYIKALL